MRRGGAVRWFFAVRWYLGAVLAGLACLASPSSAHGHEVQHEVQRGRSVALRAWYHDGKGLADLPAEVFSPADGTTPWWKGRTDRNGWLAFVPDAPGRWRVRIVDATGHGLDAVVDVPAPAEGADGAPQAPAAPPPDGNAWARPVVGVFLVAGIFWFLYRMARRPRP